MDDEERAGWLGGDDYRRAVEAAGVVELRRLQGTEAGLAAHAGATMLTTALLMWAWRTWRT